jgi:hypothetical protein
VPGRGQKTKLTNHALHHVLFIAAPAQSYRGQAGAMAISLPQLRLAMVGFFYGKPLNLHDFHKAHATFTL